MNLIILLVIEWIKGQPLGTMRPSPSAAIFLELRTAVRIRTAPLLLALARDGEYSDACDRRGRRSTTGESHVISYARTLLLCWFQEGSVKHIVVITKKWCHQQVYQSSPAFYSTKAAAVVPATAFPQTVHSPVRCNITHPFLDVFGTSHRQSDGNLSQNSAGGRIRASRVPPFGVSTFTMGTFRIATSPVSILRARTLRELT